MVDLGLSKPAGEDVDDFRRAVSARTGDATPRGPGWRPRPRTERTRCGPARALARSRAASGRTPPPRARGWCLRPASTLRRRQRSPSPGLRCAGRAVRDGTARSDANPLRCLRSRRDTSDRRHPSRPAHRRGRSRLRRGDECHHQRRRRPAGRFPRRDARRPPSAGGLAGPVPPGAARTRRRSQRHGSGSRAMCRPADAGTRARRPGALLSCPNPMRLLFSYLKDYRWLVALALGAGRHQPGLLAARPADLPLRHRQLRDPARPVHHCRVLLRRPEPAARAAVGVAFVSRVAKNFQDYYINVVTQRLGRAPLQRRHPALARPALPGVRGPAQRRDARQAAEGADRRRAARPDVHQRAVHDAGRHPVRDGLRVQRPLAHRAGLPVDGPAARACSAPC